MEQDFAFNIFNNDDDDCDTDNTNNNAEPKVYVFGYGSLLWNPGFDYTQCITGCKLIDFLMRQNL